MMILPFLAVVGGIAILLWSADRFIEGAANLAKYFKMPTLLIGMVIVGFGTSAPEIVVGAMSASQGSPGIALGNAYGSNIANIALILGVTALICPIVINSQVLKRELPILAIITLIAGYQLWDLKITLTEAIIHLILFTLVIGWMIWQGLSTKNDQLEKEVESELKEHPKTLKLALFQLVGGMLLMVVSSRILIWGAVDIATELGMSDVMIGLTIIAIGTSLPELASSITAAKKGEDDLAVGNVIGSNIFNTLGVVGIASVINQPTVQKELITRDIPLMAILTLSLFFLGFRLKGLGKIGKFAGLLLVLTFVGYTTYLITTIAG